MPGQADEGDLDILIQTAINDPIAIALAENLAGSRNTFLRYGSKRSGTAGEWKLPRLVERSRAKGIRSRSSCDLAYCRGNGIGFIRSCDSGPPSKGIRQTMMRRLRPLFDAQGCVQRNLIAVILITSRMIDKRAGPSNRTWARVRLIRSACEVVAVGDLL